MSGVHVVGPLGPHEGLIRLWKNHNLQSILHVKPEPGDSARWRGIMGALATIVARFTNNSSLNDSAIQQRYEANPQAEAQNLWNIYAPMIAVNPLFTAWQFNNEPVLGSGAERAFRLRRLAEFTRAIVDIANGHGQGVALFNFARGTPEISEWSQLFEVWRYALSKNATLPAGKKNILSLHQYGSFNKAGPGSLFHEEAWHIKRYETQVRPTLPADLKRAEYFMSEGGPDGGQDALRGWRQVYGDNEAGRQALCRDWRVYNEWLATQAGCKGSCFFTLGQEGGFGTFDISGDPVAQMLASQTYPPLKPAEPAPAPPPPVPPPPPPPTPGGTMDIELAVPYVAQRGEGANGSANDCGAAATKSLILINRTTAPQVDLLAREAAGIEGQAYPNYNGLQMTTLIELGRRYGVTLQRKKPATWDNALWEVTEHVGSKRPIIALVHYDALPLANRLEKRNGKVKGHYIVLVGVKAGKVIYHDPYHDGTGGKALRLTFEQLRAAWEANPLDDNPKYDMLIMTNPNWALPAPTVPEWTQRDAAAATWFVQQMARGLRGDEGALGALIGALQAEEKRAGLHNVLVKVAEPPLARERDKVSA